MVMFMRPRETMCGDGEYEAAGLHREETSGAGASQRLVGNQKRTSGANSCGDRESRWEEGHHSMATEPNHAGSGECAGQCPK